MSEQPAHIAAALQVGLEEGAVQVTLPADIKRGRGRPTRTEQGEINKQRKAAASERQEEISKVVDAEERFINEGWTKFIRSIAHGLRIGEAIELSGMEKGQIHTILRTNKNLKAQYDDAKLQGKWTKIDIETVESIMAQIATGGEESSLNLAARDHGVDPNVVTDLALNDAAVQAMYDAAQQMRMETMAGEILEISDDDSGDETFDGKPNNARVQRDRLRVDGRKWLMARLSYRRFGDRIKQDIEQTLIVDHAQKLHNARKRKEKLLSSRNGSDET